VIMIDLYYHHNFKSKLKVNSKMKKGCRRGEGQKEEDKIVHYTKCNKCNGKAEKRRDGI
jgi:hypothetical protein